MGSKKSPGVFIFDAALRHCATALPPSSMRSTTPREDTIVSTDGVRQVLLRCKGTGDWQRALAVLRKMPMPPKPREAVGRSYAVVLGLCGNILAKGAKWQEALMLMEMAEGWRMTPDVVLWSSVLSACGKVDAWPMALEIMSEASKKELQRDVTFYNIAMKACDGRWQWTLEILEQMKLAQVQVDTFTMNSLLSATVQGGQWRLAMQVLEEMDESGVGADIITFNTLLNAAWHKRLLSLGHALPLKQGCHWKTWVTLW